MKILKIIATTTVLLISTNIMALAQAPEKLGIGLILSTGPEAAWDGTLLRDVETVVGESPHGLEISYKNINGVWGEDAGNAMDLLAKSGKYQIIWALFNWIAGVGLDSNEKENPPIKFKEVFARARAEGYRLTMHCDVDQENSTTHIWQTLNDIGVDRIDHGVNSLEDESLCNEIIKRGLALTVCPISNGYVTDSMKALEIRQMLEKGMRATVNSDDPAYFPGYMNENLIATQEAAQLNKVQIIQLMINAFEASWLPTDKKDALLRQLDSYAA